MGNTLLILALSLAYLAGCWVSFSISKQETDVQKELKEASEFAEKALGKHLRFEDELPQEGIRIGLNIFWLTLALFWPVRLPFKLLGMLIIYLLKRSMK